MILHPDQLTDSEHEEALRRLNFNKYLRTPHAFNDPYGFKAEYHRRLGRYPNNEIFDPIAPIENYYYSKVVYQQIETEVSSSNSTEIISRSNHGRTSHCITHVLCAYCEPFYGDNEPIFYNQTNGSLDRHMALTHGIVDDHIISEPFVGWTYSGSEKLTKSVICPYSCGSLPCLAEFKINEHHDGLYRSYFKHVRDQHLLGINPTIYQSRFCSVIFTGNRQRGNTFVPYNEDSCERANECLRRETGNSELDPLRVLPNSDDGKRFVATPALERYIRELKDRNQTPGHNLSYLQTIFISSFIINLDAPSLGYLFRCATANREILTRPVFSDRVIPPPPSSVPSLAESEESIESVFEIDSDQSDIESVLDNDTYQELITPLTDVSDNGDEEEFWDNDADDEEEDLFEDDRFDEGQPMTASSDYSSDVSSIFD